MPALRLFGRAWLVACDDLVAPAAFGVLVRGVWLGCLLAFAFTHEGDSLPCPVAQCDWLLGWGCLWGYAAGSALLVGTSAVLEVAPAPLSGAAMFVAQQFSGEPRSRPRRGRVGSRARSTPQTLHALPCHTHTPCYPRRSV